MFCVEYNMRFITVTTYATAFTPCAFPRYSFRPRRLKCVMLACVVVFASVRLLEPSTTFVHSQCHGSFCSQMDGPNFAGFHCRFVSQILVAVARMKPAFTFNAGRQWHEPSTRAHRIRGPSANFEKKPTDGTCTTTIEYGNTNLATHLHIGHNLL